jgi:WD40 repeat protein
MMTRKYILFGGLVSVLLLATIVRADDKRTLQRIGTLDAPRFAHTPFTYHILPCGNQEVVTAGPSGAFRWSLKTGKKITTYPTKRKFRTLTDMAISGDNKWLFVSDRRGIYRWELATGKPAGTVCSGVIHEISPVGNSQLLSISLYGQQALWDIGGAPKKVWSSKRSERGKAYFDSLLFPGGDVFYRSRKRTINEYRLSDGKRLRSFHEPHKVNAKTAKDPNAQYSQITKMVDLGGGRLGILQQDSGYWVLDLKTGKSTEKTIPSSLLYAQLSPDKTQIAVIRYTPSPILSSSSYRRLEMYDAKTLQLQWGIDGVPSSLGQPHFTPDGKQVVLPALALRIYDAKTGKRMIPRAEDGTLGGPVNSIMPTPDGKRWLVTTKGGEGIAVWDQKTRTRRTVLLPQRVVKLLDVHPKTGQLLVSLGNRYTGQLITEKKKQERFSIGVVDVKTGKLLFESPTEKWIEYGVFAPKWKEAVLVSLHKRKDAERVLYSFSLTDRSVTHKHTFEGYDLGVTISADRRILAIVRYQNKNKPMENRRREYWLLPNVTLVGTGPTKTMWLAFSHIHPAWIWDSGGWRKFPLTLRVAEPPTKKTPADSGQKTYAPRGTYTMTGRGPDPFVIADQPHGNYFVVPIYDLYWIGRVEGGELHLQIPQKFKDSMRASYIRFMPTGELLIGSSSGTVGVYRMVPGSYTPPPKPSSGSLTVILEVEE